MITKIQIHTIQRDIRKIREKQSWPAIFAMLGDETRFCIFSILLKYDDLCVTDIARICNFTIAAVSHQLKLLEMSGLIKRVRYGKAICYKVKKEEQAVEKIKKLIE